MERPNDATGDASDGAIGPRPSNEPSGDGRAEPTPAPEPGREGELGLGSAPGRVTGDGALLDDDHWSRTRDERNAEALDFLRERSRAAGVAEGGTERNAYCLECHGVIPLNYDRRLPASERPDLVCPHCGAVQEGRVRAMFNWVETDEVPDSDLNALLPVLLAIGFLALAGLAAVLILW